MNQDITLNMLTYVIYLSIAGGFGSCYQAHKTTGTTKPFLARVLCGIIAGNATVLVSWLFKIPSQPYFHLGIAVFLGILAEVDGGLGRLMDIALMKFEKKKGWSK